ncbi:ankyrin repeat domain-containing protein [Streptomyces sp. NBC_01197]|uniref:ankyrin repeat domain-containing protein n=1 Tax=Streptomyces sp. NBC_01197 TaxID=2903768 RepID=UPI002E0E4218|nr:ankyrin repeat domain-containing protein [Streptomyces sp. NBC_01197]
MGFFDDLVVPEEPAGERPVLIRLGPPGEDDGRHTPPVDRFAPVVLPHLAVVGGGPDVRVLLTGWSVWPRSVTLHLAVFRKVRLQKADSPRQSGLRVGLLLSDGRRLTSLDGMTQRRTSFTGPRGEPVSAVQPQAVGMVPLDPGLHQSHRSLFKTDVDLYLAELPPPGETQLVVEWPDEGIAETRSPVEVGSLHAASERVLEVWPGLEPLEPAERTGTFMHVEMGGPPSFLAPPLTDSQLETARREEEARQRYAPRADWEGMGYRDWADTALVRARLEGGAPPGTEARPLGTTPLHRVAEAGAADAVAALLAYEVETDVRDQDGHTPLWYAARSVDEGSVRALIDAGADAWTPQSGPWSPGRLLLTTPLAPLVAELPGAVELPADEAAAMQAADALITAFGEQPLWTDGLGIAFVRGLSEDELIRRLGADPAQCPRAVLDEAPFGEEDYEACLRHVGVTRVDGDPGGCVITQDGYMPSDDAVLEAISAGTSAYGVYFNPKGGTFGTLARDGETVAYGEIGLYPQESDPAAYWNFRFWQTEHPFPFGANALAYACDAAGLRISDGREAVDRAAPRRWVALPERLQR